MVALAPACLAVAPFQASCEGAASAGNHAPGVEGKVGIQARHPGEGMEAWGLLHMAEEACRKEEAFLRRSMEGVPRREGERTVVALRMEEACLGAWRH